MGQCGATAMLEMSGYAQLFGENDCLLCQAPTQTADPLCISSDHVSGRSSSMSPTRFLDIFLPHYRSLDRIKNSLLGIKAPALLSGCALMTYAAAMTHARITSKVSTARSLRHVSIYAKLVDTPPVSPFLSAQSRPRQAITKNHLAIRQRGLTRACTTSSKTFSRLFVWRMHVKLMLVRYALGSPNLRPVFVYGRDGILFPLFWQDEIL